MAYLVIDIFVGNTFYRARIDRIDPSKEFSGWDSTPIGQQLHIAQELMRFRRMILLLHQKGETSKQR